MPKLRSTLNHHKFSNSHLTKPCRENNFNPGEIFQNRGNLLTMIRFYAGHECLWNCQHEDYYKQSKQKELWGWIARQFGGRLSPSHVEYHMKILHAKALCVFKRMDRCRRLGVWFPRPTFDLLDEFNFLLQEESKSISNITAQETLQSHVKYSAIKEVPFKDDLNEFCFNLKEELKHLPQHTSREIQRKISLILNTSKSENQLYKIISS